MLEAYFNPLHLHRKGFPPQTGTMSFAGQYNYFCHLCEVIYNVAKNGTFEPLVFFRQTNLLPSMADHYRHCFNKLAKDVLDPATHCVMIDWNAKQRSILKGCLAAIILNLHLAVRRTTFKPYKGRIEKPINTERLNAALDHFIAYNLQIHLVEDRIRRERIKGQTTNVAQF